MQEYSRWFVWDPWVVCNTTMKAKIHKLRPLVPHIKTLVNTHTHTLLELLQSRHSLPPPGIRPGNCLVFRVSSILPRLFVRVQAGGPHRSRTDTGPLKSMFTTTTSVIFVIKLTIHLVVQVMQQRQVVRTLTWEVQEITAPRQLWKRCLFDNCLWFVSAGSNSDTTGQAAECISLTLSHSEWRNRAGLNFMHMLPDIYPKENASLPEKKRWKGT